MSDSPTTRALFEGLIFNEEGQPAGVELVGGEPFYVVLDNDFRRFVEAKAVDRQVLSWLHEQILANEELVTQGTMSFLGKDDLFTKAMIDASIQDFEEQMERVLQVGLPEEVRAWLGMLGFRVTVNVHGEVVEIDAPSAVDDEGDW
jgi:hypothetical protein